MFVIIVAAGSAGAQATRTWVSGVGDDANPCSRTAPCKTFAGAISKTAAGGEIDVLDPGGFGAVTITKSITIDGSGGSIAGVLVSGTNGIVVSAGASDVVILRNLDINGVGTGLNGIQFNSGAMLYVENVTIYGFTQNGIAFMPSSSSGLSVERALVRENTGGNLLVKPGPSGTASVNVSESRFEGGRFGVRVEDGTEATISRSTGNGNDNNGFLAVSTTTPAELNLESCVASNNSGAYGVVASGAGATLRISNTTITHNGTGIGAVSGGSVVSFGNNRNAGNTVGGSPTSVLSQQ
jgi:hypothetical protein